MRVLWLTSFPLPDLAAALTLRPFASGGWVPSLASALMESGQVELAVATNLPGVPSQKQCLHGVHYYVVQQSRRPPGARHLPPSLIQGYQDAVEDFKPDVVHIHGTEYFHGFLTGRGHLRRPTVISIQGIVGVCERCYWGGLSLAQLLTTRTLRDWIRWDGLLEQRLKWILRAKWEREIFASHRAFIGRTLWDQAHVRQLNPTARYYPCQEVLRPPFYQAQWDLRHIRRHTLFAASAAYPLKGFHVLLKAAALLRPDFPDLTIRVPLAYFYPSASGVRRMWRNCRSTGYARYLTDLIRREGLEKHVVALQALDAPGMAEELSRAHVFVLPSFIENSPNSLAEAMLIGTPSVVSFVGGVPSMVTDEVEALTFPAGDEAVLAEQIRRVFLDDALGDELSLRARATSHRRHLPAQIARETLEIYRSVISQDHPDRA